MVVLLCVGGCREVVEWFDSPSYPQDLGDVSDLDYCDRIARATLHAEAEISTDIGREFEADHASQGPDTLQRNVGAYEEQRRFQQIVAECLRKRRAARPVGTTR
jgi:hypothetical protein